MKGKKRTPEENEDLLKKVESAAKELGVNPSKAAAHAGVTYYSYWKAKKSMGKNGHGSVREIVSVDRSSERLLRAENQRLRVIVSDLMLDIQTLKEYNAR